jgi:hypothetical protein
MRNIVQRHWSLSTGLDHPLVPLSDAAWSIPTHGCLVRDLPPDVIDLMAFRQKPNGPQPAEGLMLLKAYMTITDETQRQTILHLVTKTAAGETP